MKHALRQMFDPPPVTLVPGTRGDLLTFSMRRVADLVAYCGNYEFEDVIAAVSGADRVEPTRLDLTEFQRKIYKTLNLATSDPGLALRMTPKFGGMRLKTNYELFIAFFNNPYEVFALQSVPNWRECCRNAVCVINEVWEGQIPEYLLKSLANFDRIYLSSNPTESVARITGRPCHYLPLCADTVALSPFPESPTRSIDVLGIGRRSATTHAALLALARERGLFYYYDTIRATSVVNAEKQLTFSVIDTVEHRFKLASLLKRSRYFLANRARANEPDAAVADEMSARFFEGAAAGTIMLGLPPSSGPYLSLFDWPDAVVEIPFDEPDIGSVMADLNADVDRSVRIRRTNMTQALLRHDCAHRLRVILDDAGLPSPPALLAREALLEQLADRVQNEPIAA